MTVTLRPGTATAASAVLTTPAMVPPTLFGCVLMTGPGRPTGPGPHAADSAAKHTSNARASPIRHLLIQRAASGAPPQGFGAFPKTSTIVAATVPVLRNVCFTPPL